MTTFNLLGNLTLDAIPFHDPIIMGAASFMGCLILVAVGLLSYFKYWKKLWCDWITTVDHKKIGIMYVIISLVMLIRGFTDAMLM